MENFSIKIDENVRLRLYKICRLCGDDNPNNSDILANHKKSTNVDPDFHKKIFDCIGIQVTKGDKMPQTACDVCREKINDFFDFREMCLATDVQTRRLLGLPEMIVPKLDPALDAVEDDKTEVEKTIKKKNPVAIKALKSGKQLKCEKRSSVELRKTSSDVKRTLPETRRLSTAEARRTALPDIKKAPPDVKKGPPDTKRGQSEIIKKNPPVARQPILESKHKSQVELKKAPLDAKKTPSDAKRQPINVKKVVKLEREKTLLKLKKKVQIDAEQISNVDLKNKLKEDPERLARAKKRKASSDLLTEKPPNKRERLRETIIRKFKNPEIALDTVAANVSCTICSKSFCNAGELHRHLDTDHIPRVVSFHCVRCNESLEKKQDIKDHNLWHKLSKTPYECGRCAKTITNLAVYTKHVQNCTGFVQDFEYKTKICVTCKEEFETQNLYNWHKCVINQLKCEVCQQKFTKKGAMVKHVVRCSAIGLSTSLPVVDSAIMPDSEQEPASEADPEMNDHFADGNDSDEDDVEMNLKPNLEIDIETPRQEPEEEGKEAAPFVVIPTPTTSTEVSRPSSNSSSSVPAMISSRATSLHSNIADDDASNTSNIQIANVVAPMVCIKIESASRNSAVIEKNGTSTNNASVRVKAEVIDSAYKGLYNATTCQNIKEECNTEETPVESNPAGSIGAGVVSDETDEPNDDLPDDLASSVSVTPPPSPIPPNDPTPPPKPTLKLVIKKQHGKLNSSFVEGYDIPREECESQPKKKKKKKAKIFRIPKGLAYRLKQERMRDGNDDGSSETNNENEEDEPVQHHLPVISNVCSKYTDGAGKDKKEEDVVGNVEQIKIKQENLENDDVGQTRVSEELVINATDEAQDTEAVQNTLPAVNVLTKRSKIKRKVKNPRNTTLATTVRIKEERLDNDQEVTNTRDECEKQAPAIQIKQERIDDDEDVPNATNITEQVATEYDRSEEEADDQMQRKSLVNRLVSRSGRTKRREKNMEKLVETNVPIKQERLDCDGNEPDTHQIRLEVSEMTSNVNIQCEQDHAGHGKLPVISNVCSKFSKLSRKKDTAVPHTNVRIKQEVMDTDDIVNAVNYTLPVIAHNCSESVDPNVEKNPGSRKNRKELNFGVQVKQERIEGDVPETISEERNSNESDEESNAIVAGVDQLMSTVPDLATSTDRLLTWKKNAEVQIKQEPMHNNDDVEDNTGEDSESEQEAIATLIIASKNKSNKSKISNSKSQRSNAQRSSTRIDGVNIMIKEERADTDEPETNLSPVLPIISQVFSQHIKTEVGGETSGRSTSTTTLTTVENIKIKEEKEDNNVCIINTDDEEDEMVVAERPNIPVISLLSPDRPNHDIENLNSASTSVHVKQEKIGTDECSAVNEINTIKAISIPNSSLTPGKSLQTNQNKPTRKVNAIDRNIRIKEERDSADELTASRARPSKDKGMSTRNETQESTTTLSTKTISTCDNASTQLTLSKTTSEIRIKEEGLDDDEDDAEVQLVDLTEVIEIHDESSQVKAPTQSKRPSVNKKNKIHENISQSVENLIHIKQEEPEKEKELSDGDEESLDTGILKRQYTVINPLAARLKRSSRKRKNINPLNPANLDLLQTRVKRECVDDHYERIPPRDNVLDRAQQEEVNSSSPARSIDQETRVSNESILPRSHAQIKQEPLDVNDVRKSGAQLPVIESHRSPKKKGANKPHSINPSYKDSEDYDNITARTYREISNNENNLLEKTQVNKANSNQTCRPILRIKSEFNAFNFKDNINTPEKDTAVNDETTSITPERENIAHDIAIKTEPIFDIPIKEELPYDSETEETEELNCDGIKDEPQEFYATEEFQSPLQDNQSEQYSGAFCAEFEGGLNEVSCNEDDYVRSEERPENRAQVNITKKELQKITEDKKYATPNAQELSEQNLVVQEISATPMDGASTLEKESVSAEQLWSSEEKNIDKTCKGLDVISACKNTILDEEESSMSVSRISVEEKDLPPPEDVNDFVKELNKNAIVKSSTSEIEDYPKSSVGNVSILTEKLTDIPHLGCVSNSEMKDISLCDKMNDCMEVAADYDANLGEKPLPSISDQGLNPYTCGMETDSQILVEAPADTITMIDRDTSVSKMIQTVSRTQPDAENENLIQSTKAIVASSQSEQTNQSKMLETEHKELIEGAESKPIEDSLENVIRQPKCKQFTIVSLNLNRESLEKESGASQDVTRASEQAESEDESDKSADKQDRSMCDENENASCEHGHENDVLIEGQNVLDAESGDVNTEDVIGEGNLATSPIQVFETTNKENMLESHLQEREVIDGDIIDAKEENEVTKNDVDDETGDNVPTAEQSLRGEEASTGDVMDDQETASDEKTSDHDNNIHGSDNVDDSSEIEDMENNEDSPGNESDSDCNQKLKDLIKDNDNLLGFFEHELSRNNDSSSEERTMDKKHADYDVDSSKETTNKVQQTRAAGKVDNSVSLDNPSEDCAINPGNVLDSAKEDATHAIEEQSEEILEQEEAESQEVANTKANFNENSTVAESSTVEAVTDEKTPVSNLAPLHSEADSDLSVEKMNEPSSLDTTTALPVPTASETNQFCSLPIHSVAPINPPTVNFSINTLIGAHNAPSSSCLSNTVAPSITALPRAIVSPTISPSISSYNPSPLSSFERIAGPPLVNTTLNTPVMPISSLHSIESTSSLTLMPACVSSNVSQQLPTSHTSPLAFSNTSVQPAANSSSYSEPPSHLNMLHINEIAENNNNANIERELQNDLESISSSSNMDFDETTVNSISEFSESNALTNSNNDDNAAPDH